VHLVGFIIRVKVKLCLCLIQHNPTRKNGAVDIWYHVLLTSVSDVEKQSASCGCHFTPEKEHLIPVE